MERIAISGATGYIGIHLIEKLREEYEILAFVRAESDISRLKSLISANCIITIGQEDIYERVKEFQPNYYINLVGKFIVEHTQKNLDDLLESNFTLPTMLLDAVCQAGCKKIINTESYWQHYGGQNSNPVDMYAAAKNGFKEIIRYYVEAMECSCISLILFDTYGADDRRKKLLNCIAQMKEGESIDLTDCSQKMYFCHIKDVIKAYEVALHMISQFVSGQLQEFAVRGDKPRELKDIVMELTEMMNRKIYLNFGIREGRKREIVDPEGIGKVLTGWSCEVELHEGLREMIE